MMKGRKKLYITLGILAVVIISLLLFVFIKRNVEFEEIARIPHVFTDGPEESYDSHAWFSIHSVEFCELKEGDLKSYGTDIEETFDLDSYTYVITRGYPLQKLQYSYTHLGFSAFVGQVTLKKPREDYLFIYRIKKRNVIYHMYKGIYGYGVTFVE